MAKGGKPKWDKAEPIIPQNRRRTTAKWQTSYGMFLTGQSLIDEVTILSSRIEAKWGAGRLRMLVGAELREKFDRQRYLFNQAIWFGELEDVRTQAARMTKAWNVLDQAATNAGASQMPPDVWDVISEEGSVYAIGRTADAAKAYKRDDGKPVRVFSLEEICRILDGMAMMNAVKDHFPEAEIVDYQARAIGDALDDVETSKRGLDDPLDDEMPF